MAFRRTVPALTALLLSAPLLPALIVPLRAQETVPAPPQPTLADRILKGSRSTFQDVLPFAKSNPEDAFAIVRDNWKSETSADVKRRMIAIVAQSENPHLLEVLDLGVNDGDPAVRSTAYQHLQNFACRSFGNDPTAYAAWKKQVRGKPLQEIAADGCTETIARYRKASAADRPYLLNTLITTDFSKTELGQARRKAALAAGVLDIFREQLEQPALEPNDAFLIQRELSTLRALEPDEAYIKRTIAPLTTRNNALQIRYTAASFLGSTPFRWASDLLFDMIREDPPEPFRWTIIAAFSQTNDPHNIPRMIAVQEADKNINTLQILNFGLARLTGNKEGRMFDGAKWRAWWEQNKTRFPQDVQSAPYPKIAAHLPVPQVPQGDLRRLPERYRLAGDSRRTYWLLCPASLAPPPDRIGGRIVADGSTRAAAPNVAGPPPIRRVGLIVVLADGKGNGEELTDFWRTALSKSLNNGYCIALPIAPQWSEHQPGAWVTQRDRSQIKEAAFSTESFVNDIVADVSARYPIDPARVMLHGVGTGGLAAYACSLADTTPFKGFYILSAPFKTGQLPPLTAARGRRYLIQQSREDKQAPYFQAIAADDLLRKQAAIVKLVTTPGEQHGYPPADNAYEQITQAISWLEASH